MKILSDAKYAKTITHLKNACLFSRQHSDLTQDALKTYGDHGAQISGCIRDHFPENIKDQLRTLARKVSEESGLAYQHRPKGSRVSTVNKIGRLIAYQEGSGFYGPQPATELEAHPITLNQSEKEFILNMFDKKDDEDGQEVWTCFDPEFRESAYRRLVERNWVLFRTDGKVPEFRWNPAMHQVRNELQKIVGKDYFQPVKATIF